MTGCASRFALLAALATLAGCAVLDHGRPSRGCYRGAQSMAEHAACRAEAPAEDVPAILTAEPVRSLERARAAKATR